MPARTSNAALIALAVLALGSVRCARLADLGDGTTTGTNNSQSSDGGVSDPNVSIVPTTMTFTSANCGTDSSGTNYIAIANGGDADVPYSVQLPQGAAYRVTGVLQGTVSAHGNVKLEVFATPSLATDNGADILVTAGGAVQLIHATVNGTGPTMDLDPTLVAFGEVREQTGGGPLPVTVANHGTEALVLQSVTIDKPELWSVSVLPLTVMPGATGTLMVSLAPSATPDGTPVTGQVTTPRMTLCGAAPTLTLTGKRVDAEVVVSDADWGSQACASNPGEKDVIVSNYADTQVTYVITQQAGSNFTVVDTGDGKVGPATGTTPGTSKVQVTPKSPLPTTAPLPEWTEKLHFDFSGGVTASSYDATLHVLDHGTILTFNPNPVVFPANTNAPPQNLTIMNSGTDAVTFSMYFDANQGNAFGISLPGANLIGQVTITGNTKYTATASSNGKGMSAEAALFVYSNSPQCNQFGKVELMTTTGK